MYMRASAQGGAVPLSPPPTPPPKQTLVCVRLTAHSLSCPSPPPPFPASLPLLVSTPLHPRFPSLLSPWWHGIQCRAPLTAQDSSAAAAVLPSPHHTRALPLRTPPQGLPPPLPHAASQVPIPCSCSNAAAHIPPQGTASCCSAYRKTTAHRQHAVVASMVITASCSNGTRTQNKTELENCQTTGRLRIYTRHKTKGLLIQSIPCVPSLTFCLACLQGEGKAQGRQQHPTQHLRTRQQEDGGRRHGRR